MCSTELNQAALPFAGCMFNERRYVVKFRRTQQTDEMGALHWFVETTEKVIFNLGWLSSQKVVFELQLRQSYFISILI